MLKNAWNEIGNWRTKRQSNCTKSHPFTWTTIKLERKNLNQLENYPECAHNFVLYCLYPAGIGRLDILWSVNKFARSVTKWTQAFDRRWARLTSFFHHTSDYRQFRHEGITAQHCRLGLFQDSDFAGDLEISNSTSGGVLCIFWKLHICTLLAGCAKKANFSITPFNRI